jgi:exosortase
MANDVRTAPGENEEPIDYLGFLKRRWTPLDFVKLALLLGIAGTFYYFYGVTHIYQDMPLTAWTWGRFDARYNSEHCKLVPLIFGFLVWYHRKEIAQARKEGSNKGLIWIAVGCLIFALGARTLQGRLGMAALPVLLYGLVLYLWGKEVARAMWFPIAFLFFMVPVSGPIDQATAGLQFIVVRAAQSACGLIGIPLIRLGTMLTPVDNSYKGFDVAEGCSGIRSLTAMIMVTVIFVHLTQTKLWKQITILGCSIGFAIIGNVGRITTIFIVAKLISPRFAGGPYHEVSGYVSFPIALMAMLAVSWVLDLPFFDAARAIKTGKIEPGSPLEGLAKKDRATYDY